MSLSFLLLAVAALCALSFYFGRQRAVALSGGRYSNLHSLPAHYGTYVALWCGLPALLLLFVWHTFQGSVIEAMIIADLPAEITSDSGQLSLALNSISLIAAGNGQHLTVSPEVVDAGRRLANLQSIANAALIVVMLCGAVIGVSLSYRKISPELRARNNVERISRWVMIACSAIAILSTVGIVFSLLFEALHFFSKINPLEFLFGLEWSPQTAIRADQVASEGAFGAIPLFVGTLLITVIAMCVAVPVGLFSAIYMGEYASPKFRAVAKPALEILAGVPTVVYGFFAALTVAPFLRNNGAILGLDVSSESALAAGLVMGVMIIPFVSSLSDDVMSQVPKSLRDGSYGLGATKSETIRHVIFPAALPGIVGAVLLAVSRAIGETMIVVMAAGLAANMTVNPLQAVTTVTVQIVTLLVGDQEFDSAKTLSAFALGLVLFLVTLGLNVFALKVVQKYREKYD
ncbi:MULTISPECIES: phosphate ABC transporter permease subunit PstC [Thalassospira]|jgi:phosphate transport system permease protein|uniref:Phosphate transport system permease protein n=1 Tax=Thalassospira povalilytica TaxID=732237 RepID=A0A8I1SIT2_9PROT|nr:MULTISPECIES: phosphate ABC transporter permease subunit PstC [Thalassospira]MEE3047118.1 phosphate ABC transporter permease subunit PstC [Pseudomonadota bacterium]RCK26551.1 phosphate ABC transporter permease [Thalassospira profundimaris]MBN8195701.1 phosphate ABC transporter permease subunit PstC [Thalassospira povalilytica]MBO6769958.1 phosphate ABC transporter permease subunit PstC [Thalassospira sp.]MCC4239493.1 phosphate ABC transporter permease subunit PstC [Thalassospira povalilytic|tara:strand:+ start:1420 stop:2799 length:1380 start_codon:yes stop_codon:yes gene_type:complete